MIWALPLISRSMSTILLTFSAPLLVGQSFQLPPSDPPGFTSLEPGVIARHRASCWEELVRDLRPTVTWNGCDMLWVTVGDSGQPAFFTLDRAYKREPASES